LQGEGKIAAGSVAIHPQEPMLVTGDPLGTVCGWDLTKKVSQAQPFAEQHGAQVQDVAVSPNGRLIATASSDNTLRIWSTVTQQSLVCCLGHSKEILQVSWAPDSIRLVSASADGSVRVWDAIVGTCLLRCEGHQGRVHSVQWSPDGALLASGSGDQTLRIWNARSGGEVHQLRGFAGQIESVSWSPDSRYLAAGDAANRIHIWSALTWQPVLTWMAHADAHYLSCLAWSPDGRFLASGAYGDTAICVWDAASGRELVRFTSIERYAWRLAWSPSGAFLASKHGGAICRLWDTRKLMDTSHRQEATYHRPLSRGLRNLPSALAKLHRLRLYPPLSLLRDLLHLTGGQSAESPLSSLAAHPGLRQLVNLGWPVAARVGLVALLVRKLPFNAWMPPPGLLPQELDLALTQILAGEVMKPQAPIPPLAALRQTADGIDDRLLGLLALLGPEAVASEPGLPLGLLHRLPDLPSLNARQRRLLELRLWSNSKGHVLSSGTGGERAGITRYGKLNDLLPSQLGLPSPVLWGRYYRQELLYRAGAGPEPPCPRPTVLILDMSPPCFGPIEFTTRLAAHVIANAVLQARLPAVLVTTETTGSICLLEEPAHLVDIWIARHLEPANAVRTLDIAQTLRNTLRNDSQEPLIVLLSQPWFGAQETIPAIPGLRGLFVQYPKRNVKPVLAEQCERWENIDAGTVTSLIERLERLLR
jgi:ATP-dependent Clp protease ATP-binding subunit ClpC